MTTSQAWRAPRLPFIVLLLLGSLLGSALFVDGFVAPGNLANVARQIAVLGVLALGQTFVIAAGMMDLTVGALATLATVIAAHWMDGEASRLWSGVSVALALGLGVGALTGVLDRSLRIHSLILTIGMMTVLTGVVFLITDQSTGAPSPQLADLANEGFYGVPLSFLLLALLTLLAHIAMHHTGFGLHMQAIGSSEEGARHAGLRVAQLKAATFVISGVLAAMAGLLLLGRLGTGYPNAGTGLELDAVVAVVLGGTLLSGGRASIVGSVAAAAVLGIISNVLNLLEVSSFVQMAVKGLIVVTVVLVNRPTKQWRA